MTPFSHPLVDSALALSHAERADLALRLLHSLDLPGEEVDADQFGRELVNRVEGHRSGQIASLTLEEARAAIKNRLA